MKDWRERLADDIRTLTIAIHANADKLADQPEYVTDFGIRLRFSVDGVPIYEVTHTHIPTWKGGD